MASLPMVMSLKMLLPLILLVSGTKFVGYVKGDSAATINFTNEIDRDSLLAFKKGITVDPLGIFNSWNDSSPDICEWKGVTCGRQHQRVTVLNLGGSGLIGWISPSIGNLTFLRSIDLSNNSFHGRIPQEIGKLFRLQYLNMDNNSLGGEIPSNLSRCFHLRGLYLSKNNLEGIIPMELTTLSKLEDLKLFKNNLSGEVPHSIGNLSSLRRMSVSDNNMEGSIPYTIAQLRSLRLLSIAVNKFYGSVPAMLYNMSSLQILSMTSNRLHGTLPRNIGLALPNLRILEMATNRFSGSIPESLSNASQLQSIELSYNYFEGQIPSNLGSLQNLQTLYLRVNRLGSGKASDMNVITSLTNCKSLAELELDDNLLGGVLPNSISNLSTNLRVFLLGSNQIYGNIPISFGNMTNLSSLGLGYNLFTGNIPSSLGMLQNLEGLYLESNALTGEIPPSLGNITLLNELVLDTNRLEGTIPSTLGQCKQLQALILSKNNLSGTIPKQVLTGLSSLSIIYINVSMNSLTGPLPLEVGNLERLWGLDASQNKFNGEIPVTLGRCASLEHLHLEDNLLVGKIPMTLKALEGLSDLDLSKNNLSGPIPEYLESFPLQYLNLSFNNLEGEVPKGGAFGNSSRVFVGGNTKLCGGLGELHLPRCTMKQSIKRGRTLHMKLLIAVVISVVGCLLLLFLVMIISCRLRKTKKRLPSTPSMDKFNRIKLSYEDLFKATDGFSTKSLIGSGSFGCVYKGVLNRDEAIVAVKVLNLEQRGASKTFEAECNALRNIKHRNLVKILTSCSSIDSKGNDFKALVFEFMSNGSLEQWLHPRHDEEHDQPRKLSLVQRTNILVDVASALDYLHHHCHTMIVHCDLKPSNVLLDADMNAHVGDFGLARFFSQTHQNFSSTQSSSIGIKGSIGYSAPEYGIGGEASTQGDAYSFGVLLLEMMTGRRPTDEMFGEGLNLHTFAKMALPERVMQIVDPELLILEDMMMAEEDPSMNERHNRKGDKMQQCIIRLVKIGVDCSMEAPRERMDMSHVAKELHLIRRTFLDVRII